MADIVILVSIGAGVFAGNLLLGRAAARLNDRRLRAMREVGSVYTHDLSNRARSLLIKYRYPEPSTFLGCGVLDTDIDIDIEGAQQVDDEDYDEVEEEEEEEEGRNGVTQQEEAEGGQGRQELGSNVACSSSEREREHMGLGGGGGGGADDADMDAAGALPDSREANGARSLLSWGNRRDSTRTTNTSGTFRSSWRRRLGKCRPRARSNSSRPTGISFSPHGSFTKGVPTKYTEARLVRSGDEGGGGCGEDDQVVGQKQQQQQRHCGCNSTSHPSEEEDEHVCMERRGSLHHLVADKDGRPDRLSQGDGEMCLICLEPYQPGDALVMLPCRHVFHEACAESWFASRKTCPLDRLDLNVLATEMVEAEKRAAAAAAVAKKQRKKEERKQQRQQKREQRQQRGRKGLTGRLARNMNKARHWRGGCGSRRAVVAEGVPVSSGSARSTATGQEHCDTTTTGTVIMTSHSSVGHLQPQSPPGAATE